MTIKVRPKGTFQETICLHTPDIQTLDVQDGDRFLLGLYPVGDHELLASLTSGKPEVEIVEHLLKKSLQAGGHDNITALLIGVHQVGGAQQPT